ncbi:AAA family ATPase [Streptomyces thinghirensis]|nr:AAA family ATPase [Streptomyces thinghirensis]
MSGLLRAPAEIKYAEELDWLESIDDSPKPALAAVAEDGPSVHSRLRALRRPGPRGPRRSGSATEACRAVHRHPRLRLRLLLIGDPGTGKSWLAELLSAAISRNSTLVVQGTAGTTEDHTGTRGTSPWSSPRAVAGVDDPLADHDGDGGRIIGRFLRSRPAPRVTCRTR